MYEALMSWHPWVSIPRGIISAVVFYSFCIFLGEASLKILCINEKNDYVCNIYDKNIKLLTGLIVASALVLLAPKLVIDYYIYLYILFFPYTLFKYINLLKTYFNKLSLIICENKYVALLLLPQIILLIIMTSMPVIKADELAYHLVEAQRIAINRVFTPYSSPIEGSSVLSMAYQRLQIYFISTGDISGLSFFSLGVYLKCIVLIYQKLKNIKNAIIFLVPLALGLDIFIDLSSINSASIAFFILLLLIFEFWDSRVEDRVVSADRIIFLSILLLCAKISYLPIFIACCMYVSYHRLIFTIPRLTLFILLIYVIPSIVISYNYFKAPFGWFLSDIFGIHLNYQKFDGPGFTTSGFDFFVTALMKWHFIVLISMLLFITLFKKLTGKIRFIQALFFIQLTSIVIFAPWELRYLGAFIVFPYVYFLSTGLIKNQHYKFLTAAIIISVVPYTAQAIYFNKDRFSYATAFETRNIFFANYIPFWSDFEALKLIIPNDSVIFLNFYRAYPAYSPFIAVNNIQDFSNISSKHKYILFESKDFNEVASNFKIGKKVYSNEDSIMIAFRSPNKIPKKIPIEVWSIEGGKYE